MDEGATTSPGCTFFKKSIGNKNMRKRVIEEDDSDEGGSGPSVVRKGKAGTRKGDGALAFSTQSTAAPQRDSITEGDAEPEINTSKLRPFFYESSRQVQTESDNKATAVLETETEFDKDARAIRERVLKQADEALKGKASTANNLYKGLHGYKDHKAGFRREHTISAEKAGGAHGPLRASAHIRWSVRFDYQPDICKDYKETGYCGYGDACKFMHDRGDYKAGWQIDRECEEAEKRKKAKLAAGTIDEEEEEEEDDSDELPFACFICRQPFQNPVITSCKHYFCEHCALKHHSRNKRCFVCNKPTNGVFNTAHDILKRSKGDGHVAGKTTK